MTIREGGGAGVVQHATILTGDGDHSRNRRVPILMCRNVLVLLRTGNRLPRRTLYRRRLPRRLPKKPPKNAQRTLPRNRPRSLPRSLPETHPPNPQKTHPRKPPRKPPKGPPRTRSTPTSSPQKRRTTTPITARARAVAIRHRSATSTRGCEPPTSLRASLLSSSGTRRG